MMMFLFQIIDFFRKYLRDQQDNVHQPVFIGKITPCMVMQDPEANLRSIIFGILNIA